jgi:predicted permease
METAGKEITFAARRLARAPAFTLAAVCTLALAIAANVAIFAVVEGIVLKPLPYPDSDRLIELQHGAERLNVPSGIGMTLGLYYHYAERARTLDGIAVHNTEAMTLTGGGEPERIRVTRATPSLASVLGVSPAVGRWFADDDGRPGASPVVLLSHRLWQRRYGGDAGLVGRPVMLGGVAMQVIGIMPPGFVFPSPQVDAWTAMQSERAMGFGLWNYEGVARLRRGATVSDARAELNGLIHGLTQAFPGDLYAQGNGEAIGLMSTARTLKEAMTGSVARALWTLLASVGVVLLVACANVANLFLVRSEVRQRELAVRRALGAGSAAMARFFLSESLLLSAAGGLIGVALAWAGIRLLVDLGPATLPRLGEVGIDAAVLAFAIGLSVFGAMMFGTIPLLREAPTVSALGDAGRANTAGRSRQHARRVLMAAQVALALVLLVASALMVRSFQKLRAVDPGFNPASTLTFSLGLPARDYPTRTAIVASHRATLQRLAALPGVTAVSASTCLPLSGGCFANTLLVEGKPLPPGMIPPIAFFRAVAGGYLETMGIRVVRGRGIGQDDVDRSEPVVVINQALANVFFPHEDPIGRRIASNRAPDRPGEAPRLTWLRVVGVVVNTPSRSLGEAATLPQLYMPMSIARGPDTPILVGPEIAVMTYVVRAGALPLGLMPAVRHAIDGVDPNLAMALVRTLQALVDAASAQMAFTMVLIALAGAVALLLGLIGIYGVMSYIVAERTSEIGIRLALGAEPRLVRRMIVRQGGVAAVAGAVAGVAASLAGARLIESLLYGVNPRDPVIVAGTTAMLLAVALAACWLPARKASHMNPLDALRSD